MDTSTMLVISQIFVVVGVSASVIGTAKAIKSKFGDLNAIIWCFAGVAITSIGTSLTIYL